MSTIQQLSDWLESNIGESLTIKKGELSTGSNEIIDLDQVNLQLKRVSLISNNQNIDEYIPSQEMVLHGEGKIKSDRRETYLPQNAYEIPLFGEINMTQVTNGLRLETEKAIYIIEH